MRARGRKAEPRANPSVQRALKLGEAQYSTSISCDCGTAFSPRMAEEPDYDRIADKLRRRGWSEAKIERSLEQMRDKIHRPKGKASDSVAYWIGVLRELPAETGATSVGLLLHWYSGPSTKRCSKSLEMKLR